MTITLLTPSLEGIVGGKIVSFKMNCSKIPRSKQSWSISPKLPSNLSLNESTGVISGKAKNKHKSSHIVTVSGNGKSFETELDISILKPLPSNIANLVKNLAADGSSIGHGICEFIDNSIDANATEIKIFMSAEVISDDPAKLQRPWVLVQDNGKGILKEGEVNVEALQDALGMATSPDTEYDETRLGAFGVGLPAAALTSARFCTIFTKRDGNSAIGHMSYDDIEKSKSLRFFEYDDIPDNLKEANSFQHATKLLEKMNSGTLVLLQDHYQLRRSIVEPGTEIKFQEFKAHLNTIKLRLKDHLSLIYHKFLEPGGVDLRKHDGTTVNKRISIELGGKLNPLDPLMEHCDSDKVGKLGTHIKSLEKAICTIQEMERYYSIKMAVLPGLKNEGGYGRTTRDGRDFDKAIGNALLVFNSTEGSDKPPQPRESQGLYLYRNHRIIEFATWKGLFANAPQSQVARVAVSTPLGLPIHDPKLNIQNDFSVDQRKRKMTVSSKVGLEIKTVLEKHRHWHVDDTKQHAFIARTKKRSEYDNLGKKGKKARGIKIEKAVIEPSVIPDAFVPFSFIFKDLTPISGKSPTRQWILDAKQIGTGKECPVTIEEAGEHKVVLTITSGKKKWQHSLKFNTLNRPKGGKKQRKSEKNEWKVVLNPSDSSEPPIVLDGTTYEINPNNKALNDVIKMMGMLKGG